MDNEPNTLEITDQDISYLEAELAKTKKPLMMQELTEKLAYLKTANQRIQDVKKYDPNCSYDIGDSIYKEYDEPLTTSSKNVEQFKGAVVFKVVNKSFYSSFNCEMLEVDYTGGGVFRKYIDYMKKTKTQVLLPSNLDGKALAPELMPRTEDPRLSELPMTDRDLKTLERRLKTALSKVPKFLNWNDYWQLEQSQVEIPEEKIRQIQDAILETRKSSATEEMVKNFLDQEPSHELFDLHCFSLNYVLEKKYKKEFVFVSPLRWGKWHLKKVLNSFPEDLPISASTTKLPEIEGLEKPKLSTFTDFPLKIYLTWREVLSGAVKIPKSLNKELVHSREYIFTDAEEGKNYTVYYYPGASFFLGLKDFFANNNVPQGTSMTLEKKSPVQFTFWLKRSKKKLTVTKLDYDAKEDKLTDTGEEVFTYFMPNKIIYLERETLANLLSLYPERDDMDLQQLLVLIFKNFSLQANNYSLHYLRAYHLVDILKQTNQEDVELVLLNSFEFSKSEKKKGIFLYNEPEPLEVKEEKPAELLERPTEVRPEPLAFEASAEALEAVTPQAAEVQEEVQVEAAPPELEVTVEMRAKPEAKAPPKKEKLPKKKKLKPEGEKAPRLRKGVKKIIEERIEIQESVQEALSAIKEEEGHEVAEKRAEAQAKEKKPEIKRVAPEEVSFGLFAEKLKSALDKKKKEDKKKK